MFRSQIKELKSKIRFLDIIGSIRKKKIYAMFSSRAVIKIKRRIKMAVLLNTGADVNIIIVKIADAANLLILEIIPIEVEIFTGYNI
jgi:hypothetical protein